MDRDGFRAMLVAISDRLDEENVSKLKFLCKEIGRKKLEKIENGLQLFECLIERAEIGPNNTVLLRRLLKDINQTALLEIIEDYERQATGTPAGLLDPKELEKINIATEVIVEHLGRKWLQVGRRLGLNETKLQGIQDKHSRDLEEQVRELVREWMKIRQEAARVDDVIKALRHCKQNLTADLVEKQLEHLSPP